MTNKKQRACHGFRATCSGQGLLSAQVLRARHGSCQNCVKTDLGDDAPRTTACILLWGKLLEQGQRSMRWPPRLERAGTRYTIDVEVEDGGVRQVALPTPNRGASVSNGALLPPRQVDPALVAGLCPRAQSQGGTLIEIAR